MEWQGKLQIPEAINHKSINTKDFHEGNESCFRFQFPLGEVSHSAKTQNSGGMPLFCPGRYYGI